MFSMCFTVGLAVYLYIRGGLAYGATGEFPVGLQQQHWILLDGVVEINLWSLN